MDTLKGLPEAVEAQDAFASSIEARDDALALLATTPGIGRRALILPGAAVHACITPRLLMATRMPYPWVCVWCVWAALAAPGINQKPPCRHATCLVLVLKPGPP